MSPTPNELMREVRKGVLHMRSAKTRRRKVVPSDGAAMRAGSTKVCGAELPGQECCLVPECDGPRASSRAANDSRQARDGPGSLSSCCVRVSVGVGSSLNGVKLALPRDKSRGEGFLEAFEDLCDLLEPIRAPYIIVMSDDRR